MLRGRLRGAAGGSERVPRIPAPVFVTEKMILRVPQLRDSWQIYRHLRDPLMRRFLRTPKVPRPWHGLAFVLRSLLGRWRGRRLDLMLVLKETGQVVGCRTYFNVSLAAPSSAELGVWLARPYWGSKLAWEGWRESSVFMYGTLKIHRMYYRVHERNVQAKPKENVDNELPSTCEGKLRDCVRRGDGYETMLLYSRLRTEPRTIEWMREQGVELES